MPSRYYERLINLKGTTYEESYHSIDIPDDESRTTFQLLDKWGSILHEQVSVKPDLFGAEWEILPSKKPMPPEWRQPLPWQIPLIHKAYLDDQEKCLPLNPSSASFTLKDDFGRLVMDKRTYTNPDGGPLTDPGKLNITGGEGDFPTESPVAILLREFQQEFGVNLAPDDYLRHEDLYDPFKGRMVVVFEIIPRLEELWLRQYGNDASGLIDVWRKFESLGMNRLYREDLEAAITATHVTSITVDLLQANPEDFWPTYKNLEREFEYKLSNLQI